MTWGKNVQPGKPTLSQSEPRKPVNPTKNVCNKTHKPESGEAKNHKIEPSRSPTSQKL